MLTLAQSISLQPHLGSHIYWIEWHSEAQETAATCVLCVKLKQLGRVVQASASRKQMGYMFDALKTYVPEMVELLIDCVRNLVFFDWDVNDRLQKVKVGFSGPLVNPLLAPESAIDRLNSTILEKFVAENYTACRMVLAASGVEHEELVTVAESLLSDIPEGSYTPVPKSIYTGGDFRCQADLGDHKTHFAVALEFSSGWSNDHDTTTLTVLQPTRIYKTFSCRC